MASTYSLSVAAEVRAEMARQRRSQADVAAAIGWSQQTLQRRVAGDLPFSVDELETIADELGVLVTQFTAPPVRSAS